MQIADGGLVGKRCGNLVIAKAADDDSNGQNGTDYIKKLTGIPRTVFFVIIITSSHDL